MEDNNFANEYIPQKKSSLEKSPENKCFDNCEDFKDMHFPEDDEEERNFKEDLLKRNM